MIQKQRDSIFALLRNYHENPIPAELASSETGTLILELETLQEKVTGMVLGLVSGKGEFFDWEPNLNEFAVKVRLKAPRADTEKLLNAKVNQLLEVMLLVQKTHTI